MIRSAARCMEVRKFLILDFSPEMIPTNAEAWEISQNYLKPLPGTVRRIRRASRGEVSRYTYLEWKGGLPEVAETICETDIDHAEYTERLRDFSPVREPIRMMRHRFHIGPHECCVDVHLLPIPWLRTLKIVERDSDFLPNSWKLRDVSNDPIFFNYYIAGGTLIRDRPVAA